MRGGLIFATVLLACFTAPRSAFLQGVVIVGTGCAFGAFWAPATAKLLDAADAPETDEALASALMNLAWASGQVLGSGGAGPVAKVTNDFVPTAITASLCAATLLGILLVPARRSLLPRHKAICALPDEPAPCGPTERRLNAD